MTDKFSPIEAEMEHTEKKMVKRPLFATWKLVIRTQENDGAPIWSLGVSIIETAAN